MRASEHRDIDATITTRELAYMIKKAKIDFKSLKGSEPDFDLGESTGGATIFGCSGGVMEAALRFGYFALTGKNLPQPEVKAVRAHKGVKEAMIPVPGVGDIKVCVISGLDNAKPIIKQVKEGKCPYHFIEVMTCPGGCVNGGGQPIPPDVRVASAGLFRSVIGRMNRKFNMRSMGKGVKS
jgi:ferredoxin hydrogenase large subunit